MYWLLQTDFVDIVYGGPAAAVRYSATEIIFISTTTSNVYWDTCSRDLQQIIYFFQSTFELHKV